MDKDIVSGDGAKARCVFVNFLQMKIDEELGPVEEEQL